MGEHPKTEVGKRVVHFPASIKPNVKHHLGRYVGAAADSWIFTGERSGDASRPHVFAKAFRDTQLATQRPTLTLHDLRQRADT